MAVDATVLPGHPAIDPAVRTGLPISLPPASPVAGGPRWLLPAVLVAGIAALVACLFVGGSAAVVAVAGLPDAGGGTQWALPVASFIAETAAVLALGGALLAAALIPPRVSSRPSAPAACAPPGRWRHSPPPRRSWCSC